MVNCNLVMITDRNRAIYKTPIWPESNKYIIITSDRAYYLFKCLFQYHKATEPEYKHQQLPKYVIGDYCTRRLNTTSLCYDSFGGKY